MQLEVLPDGQFAIEREGLRHVADVAPGLHVVRPIGLAEQFGSAAGRRQEAQTSIFIVVDLPQPFEPRKPKISPRGKS